MPRLNPVFQKMLSLGSLYKVKHSWII